MPDFDAISARYSRASDEARLRWRTRLDLSYGPSPDERFDIYCPNDQADSAPIHLFIHGGYWRSNRKEDYGFVANAVCGAGGIAVIMEYSLLPSTRMAVLVDQVRRAAQWIADHAESLGADTGRFSAGGHSAGAHLATFLLSGTGRQAGAIGYPIPTLFLLSGIYDLAPLAKSFLQPEIRLSDEEIQAWSPLRSDFGIGIVSILVGEQETPPFHAQAEAMTAHLAKAGVETHFVIVPGANHMTIVAELEDDQSPVSIRLTECITKPPRPSLAQQEPMF